jgi:hypothetical protein
MPLDIVVAGLVAPADAPPEMRELRMPALEKWLARAEIARDDSRSAHDWLARPFGIARPAPVAAIELAQSGERPAGAWLRADPVHLRVDREATTLHAGTALDIGHDEARALVAALQAHFRDDPLEFRMASPERWYVRLPVDEMPATTPLDEALARGVRKSWPSGGARIKWPSAMTEIQMLFSAQETNASREREGRPPVNSVWFWGGGELPAEVDAPYTQICASDPFTRGLAALSGAELISTPARLREVNAKAATLVVTDAPMAALRRADAAQWMEAMQRLDRDWFADLGELVSKFGAVRIVATSAAGTLVASLSPASRWRLFARRKPLAAHA